MAAPALAAPPVEAVRAVQAAAGLAPLDAGAIRFTAIQPAGRGATVYEATRNGGGARRTIIDLTSEAPGRWAVIARETKPVAGETLDYLAGRIDAALAAPPEAAPCDDGTDYYAEHGGSGIEGCATDHPNAAIARALGLAEPVAP
ncbi:hypothetical protein [Sphingomonas solaris]|uniref:Uncharacterized protein n=1 Tax=Alterirhizorhabdus solaris TaxID=2529389 RepID=A0A558RAB9_9SPHN|nr:hypothetical protein [Sphingomonas solaris]TVV76329.1 hypothetical protein FOY91_04655 [Sphingomonas solaris]